MHPAHLGANQQLVTFPKARPDKKTIYVSSTASARESSGAPTTPFATLSSAFAIARAGDTVRIASGLYPEDRRALRIPQGVLVECGWSADFAARTTNDLARLERRADGLDYETGATKPFSGVSAGLQWVPERSNQNIGFSSLTPYAQGRVEGTGRFFYPKGALDQERLYERGVPKSMTQYYSNGEKKFWSELNAQGRGEGKLTVWYPDGTLLSQMNRDAQSRFHGEAREYSEDGQLKAHLLWEHGTLARIYFETPAQTEHRLEKYGKVPWEVTAASTTNTNAHAK